MSTMLDRMVSRGTKNTEEETRIKTSIFLVFESLVKNESLNDNEFVSIFVQVFL